MPQEVAIFIISVIGLFLLFWIIKNVTFTDNCPQCKSSQFVKRQQRSLVTKYILFFLRLKKNMCKKCIRTFYHAYASDL